VLRPKDKSGSYYELLHDYKSEDENSNYETEEERNK
jgi:hypothetical protein